jgi:TPP-dependent pyruvate/acetoin dehydrogenase alpha subunit
MLKNSRPVPQGERSREDTMMCFKDSLMVNRSKNSAAKRSTATHGPKTSSPQPRAGMKVTVDSDILKRLYARMLKCRMAGERAQLILHRDGHTGDSRVAHEKEAAIAGATIDLLPEDAVAPPRDGIAIHFAIGTPLAQVFAQIFARKAGAERNPTSSPQPEQVSLHVVPAEAAASSQLGLAAGVALAYKLQKGHNVVVAVTDMSSLNFGSSHEALNFTAVHGLPMIVVVESGIGVDAESSKAQIDITVKAEAYGIPGIAVDGNDAIAVYRVAREAINRARGGRGPSLIECRTFDSAMDPISHVERYLEKHGWWTTGWKRQLAKEYRREIDEAVIAAKSFAASVKNKPGGGPPGYKSGSSLP